MSSFLPKIWPHIDFLGLQLFGKTRKDFLCTIVHSHFDMLSLFFRGCPLNLFKVELSPYKMTISKYFQIRIVKLLPSLIFIAKCIQLSCTISIRLYERMGSIKFPPQYTPHGVIICLPLLKL